MRRLSPNPLGERLAPGAVAHCGPPRLPQGHKRECPDCHALEK
jgi:hypothetical protein